MICFHIGDASTSMILTVKHFPHLPANYVFCASGFVQSLSVVGLFRPRLVFFLKDLLLATVTWTFLLNYRPVSR